MRRGDIGSAVQQLAKLADVDDKASNQVTKHLGLIPPEASLDFVKRLPAALVRIIGEKRSTNAFRHGKALCHEWLSGYRAGGNPGAVMLCVAFDVQRGDDVERFSALIVTDSPADFVDHVKREATAVSVMES